MELGREKPRVKTGPDVQTSPPSVCAVCGSPAKTRYCSRECRLTAKLLATRSRRPLKDHVCQCGLCGKSFPVGRRRKVVPESNGKHAHQEVR